MATLLPFVDIGGFFAKARPSRSYGLALRLREAAPDGMWLSVESPTHSTRPWPDGGPRGLIVVGESHPTGHDQDTGRYYDDLVAVGSTHVRGGGGGAPLVGAGPCER